jgi:hypothetical protein
MSHTSIRLHGATFQKTGIFILVTMRTSELMKELCSLYSSPNIMKVGKMGEACSTYEGDDNAYKILVGKPEGKRPLGRLTGIDGRMILKWILGNRVRACGLDSYASE